MISDPSCTRCPLHKGIRSVCVPGRGSEEPTFLFIGQAPGEQEDLANQSWAGPSGKLLTKYIQQYDLRPARLSNAVRCWPPKDREPKKEEIEACKSYLLAEIKKYNPKYVVAVGGTALTALTGKCGITDWAGREVGNLEGSKVFALLHPSHVLRSPKMAGKFEAGFKALKQASQGVKSERKVPFELVPPAKAMDGLHQHLKGGGGTVTFDLETTGKHLHDGGKIRCVSLCYGDTVQVAVGGDDEWVKKLLGYLGEHCRLNAHGGVFERRWMLDLGLGEPLDMIYDTMLLDYCFFEERMHDLESVAGYWLD